jgi:hypothetical protein
VTERGERVCTEVAVSPEGQTTAIWTIPPRETLQIAREVRALVEAD